MKIFVADEDGGSNYVGVESSFKLGIKAELIKDAKKVGDSVKVCVPEGVSWMGERGALLGKTISVRGSIEATFCGKRIFPDY